MFFYTSKIFWMLFSPLNLIFLLLMGGAVFSLFARSLGRSVMALGVFLLLVFGLLPVGHNMLAALENRYERPATMPERVDGIVVLGGSFMTQISGDRNIPALNETAERIIDGLALAKKYPQALIVFSGGIGNLTGGDRTEADDAALFLDYVGFPDENVVYEEDSRTTFENIRFTRKLVLPQPEETWLLVTSAYHMPRSMAVARAAGWGDIIPYPTDYRTDGYAGWLPQDFDLLGNIYDLHVALHEYLGFLGYHVTGKISLR